MIRNSTAQSKDTRASSFGDRRGRQTKPPHDPIAIAVGILNVVRKRIDDGQPLDARYVQGLPDDVWIDLCDLATPNEMRVITEARDGTWQEMIEQAETRYERERLRLAFVKA